MSDLTSELLAEYLRRRADYDSDPEAYVGRHRNTRYLDPAATGFVAGSLIDYPDGDVWDLDDTYSSIVATGRHNGAM